MKRSEDLPNKIKDLIDDEVTQLAFNNLGVREITNEGAIELPSVLSKMNDSTINYQNISKIANRFGEKLIPPKNGIHLFHVLQSLATREWKH